MLPLLGVLGVTVLLRVVGVTVLLRVLGVTVLPGAVGSGRPVGGDGRFISSVSGVLGIWLLVGEPVGRPVGGDGRFISSDAVALTGTTRFVPGLIRGGNVLLRWGMGGLFVACGNSLFTLRGGSVLVDDCALLFVGTPTFLVFMLFVDTPTFLVFLLFVDTPTFLVIPFGLGTLFVDAPAFLVIPFGLGTLFVLISARTFVTIPLFCVFTLGLNRFAMLTALFLLPARRFLIVFSFSSFVLFLRSALRTSDPFTILFFARSALSSFFLSEFCNFLSLSNFCNLCFPLFARCWMITFLFLGSVGCAAFGTIAGIVFLFAIRIRCFGMTMGSGNLFLCIICVITCLSVCTFDFPIFMPSLFAALTRSALLGLGTRNTL